jgi:hypothetical protein
LLYYIQQKWLVDNFICERKKEMAEEKKAEAPKAELKAADLEELYRGWWGRLRNNRFVRDQLFGASIAGIFDSLFHVDALRQEGKKPDQAPRDGAKKDHNLLLLVSLCLFFGFLWAASAWGIHSTVTGIEVVGLAWVVAVVWRLLKLWHTLRRWRRESGKRIMREILERMSNLEYTFVDGDGKMDRQRNDEVIDLVKEEVKLGDSRVNNLLAQLRRHKPAINPNDESTWPAELRDDAPTHGQFRTWLTNLVSG